MDGDQDLPRELLDRLHDALGQSRAESGKALRTLLEFANRDLKGQVTSVLTPTDGDSLCFFASTDATFTAENFPVVPIGSSIAGFVYLSGQSMGLDDAQRSSHFYADIDEQSGFHTREYLAIPVVLGENVIGVMTVANRSEALENPMFSGEELRLAGKYARLCALVLDHDDHIRRQTGATEEALGQMIAGQGAAARAGPSIRRSRAGDLRAQVRQSLNGLGERDLELVRDLADRLAARESSGPQ